MVKYLDITLIIVLCLATSCHTRVISGLRQARLSLAEPMPYYYYTNIDGQPGTYSYGYDVSDPATGNTQYKTEERYPNGTVVGSYGYIDPWGTPQMYRYVADEKGYRVMRDRPNQLPVVQATPSPVLNPDSIPAESSITWSRPKKPYKNKNGSKNGADRRQFVNRHNNYVHPPSYYASL